MQFGIYVLGMLAAFLECSRRSWNARGGVDLAFVSAATAETMPRDSTSDLSLKMLIALSAGLCLWVVYGILKQDWVIVLANSTDATRSLAVLGFKIRDLNS